ncbi:phage integrase family protein [Prauserella shujinwangii]|uniref:Phage integrase family protein n=1 Tax=Prauserella shujinwangii TaxID=1453103 RepID=A0A2T0LQR8_9PSEU|nr:tyrosine-type recombinase/integrase [Prauserella shujinwangii]PRX45649.1 phage integrase family protein [Prauserella shujinwangii]
METTHKVRIWAIKTYTGKKSTYRVRWIVDGKEFGDSFDTFALADSFRARLVSASRNGEAFEKDSGLPVSLIREQRRMSWYEFACKYADMKWPDASPKYRKSLAESLMTITVPMLRPERPLPDAKLLRKALKTAYSKRAREKNTSTEVATALRLAERASRSVADLAKPEILREVLRALELKLDGNRAAGNTVRLRRVALGNAIDYAIELKLLDDNPLAEVKTRKRKFTLRQVDPQAVVNPMQARMLLDAVGTLGKQGPPLVAFFGLMYYAGLRPEEGANLKKENLSLPPSGWGEIRLEKARPEIGQEWTDSGQASEEGPLKHREDNTGRTVPCPPTLTALLHDHLSRFGTAPDGRLFRGARDGGRIGSTVYGRVWAAARAKVFTADVLAGPLAKRPYDLRHAAVSTWLTAGVTPTKVAEWAGHSLTVLLRVYAKCLDGSEQAERDRVQRMLDG